MATGELNKQKYNTIIDFIAQGMRWARKEVEKGVKKKGQFRTTEEWLLQWPEQRERFMRDRKAHMEAVKRLEKGPFKGPFKSDIACMDDFNDEWPAGGEKEIGGDLMETIADKKAVHK